MGSVSRKSLLLVGTSLILGVLFTYLFWMKAPGVSVTIFVMLIIAGFALLSSVSRVRVRNDILLILGATAFFGIMPAIRSNILLLLLDIAAIASLLLLLAEVTVRESLFEFTITDYLKLYIPPFQYLS